MTPGVPQLLLIRLKDLGISHPWTLGVRFSPHRRQLVLEIHEPWPLQYVPSRHVVLPLLIAPARYEGARRYDHHVQHGVFIGAPTERDPLVGANGGSATFTIPQQPIRRRLQNVPPFVVTRGGEYFFAPSRSELRWIAELDT